MSGFEIYLLVLFIPLLLPIAGFIVGRDYAREPPIYDGYDVAWINEIIERNMPEELKSRYFNDPDGWWFVQWSKTGKVRRVIGLDLHGVGMKNGLDVSGLPKLIRLDCRDNQLTSIRLSRLRRLTTLDCRGNRLISLDLSGLPRLTDLDCRDNRLISIILPRRWPSVTCLYCSDDGPPVIVSPRGVRRRTFYCQNNPLAIIGPSWGSKLTCFIPPEKSADRPAERREERNEAG